MPSLTPDQRAALSALPVLDGPPLSLPYGRGLTHLQFRRFAGCPICNLHLQAFIRRSDELQAAGVSEVVVFHSGAESLRAHHAQAPFALVPDPEKALYRLFGVEASLLSVLHPGSWLPALRGTLRHGIHLPGRGEGPLGRPADFLLAPDGTVLKSKYGLHANDQWSLQEVLEFAREATA